MNNPMRTILKALLMTLAAQAGDIGDEGLIAQPAH